MVCFNLPLNSKGKASKNEAKFGSTFYFDDGVDGKQQQIILGRIDMKNGCFTVQLSAGRKKNHRGFILCLQSKVGEGLVKGGRLSLIFGIGKIPQAVSVWWHKLIQIALKT